MAIQRIVDTSARDDDANEQAVEVTLRPQRFDEYIGQERLKTNLKLAIDASKKRSEPVDHILLYGPPGLGKTTMANVIANEMGANLRVTSGPAIEKAGDLASIITNLQDGDILFIDEIHRLSRTVEEILYSAMEDFKLDIVIGKGPAARSIRLDLPKFSVIGATTRTGSLAAPLRDRFGHLYRLEFYNPDEIVDGKKLREHLGSNQIARYETGSVSIWKKEQKDCTSNGEEGKVQADRKSSSPKSKKI